MRCTENQQKKTGVLVGIAKKSYDLVKIVNEFSLHTVVHIKRKNSRRYFFFFSYRERNNLSERFSDSQCFA